MTASGVRLLARKPGDIVALCKSRPVAMEEFLAQVAGLAGMLPDAGPVINICEDRYHFLVGFAAALSRGLTTLLPPSPLDEAVHAIWRSWRGSCVLIDEPRRALDAPVVNFDASVTGPIVNPAIPGSLLAAVAFTSGTTGSSVPQAKSWQSLVGSMEINLRYYYPVAPVPVVVVSTVPPQHMYGFETTILSALRGQVTMHDGRPFYPANVATALREAPAPRVLVSTPVHLRALVASGLAFPQLARVLSATAPLETDLANEVEGAFGCEVTEIYGCTEVGSMAWRRPEYGQNWRFFEGFHANVRDGSTEIVAAHLQSAVRLPDCIEFDADGGFKLVGRDSDIVKIGGKRTSLAEVTRLIMAIPGVDDAVVFRAPDATDNTRLAALIVARDGSMDRSGVRAALMPVLDPVFIPRPMHFVSVLPRGPTGKLQRDALLQVFAEATVVEAARG